MNIRRLEFLAITALFFAVLAILPPWRHVTHVVHESSCKLMATPAMQGLDIASLSVHLRGFPRLLFLGLILAFAISLLLKCCKKNECSTKEMYACAGCSTPYRPGNKYCHSCGAEL